ncbi:MAG TPA: plastocyanin/azurin family copper-binding protein [Candidatus Nanoarchaeia archaeon]|nr:plastocyanin/azurin family copper-binding protein [Candidatus Nanoarchaeia archaeon]
MRKTFLIISILMMLALLVACSPEQVVPETEEPVVPEEQTAPTPTETEEEVVPSSEHTVRITSSGFEPKTLTIKTGTTVTFTNEDSNQHWPASAMHPTHTAYPESGGCIGSKFDACKGLAQGESFSFTFNEIGSWGYHDHLRASMTGKIVVE